jgi:hypothetical protein
VTTAGDFTVEGRFWIQPETGAVVQTVLTFTSAIYEHNVEVQYGIRSGIDGWVPIRMFESHSVGLSTTGSSGSGTGRVGLGPTTSYSDGLTTYQGHRKFEMKPAFAIR